MASRHNESFYCTFNLEKVFAKIREMLFLLQSSLMRSGVECVHKTLLIFTSLIHSTVFKNVSFKMEGENAVRFCFY